MTEFQIIATAFIGVVATARLTRLGVHDAFPPVAWLRGQWDKLTRDGSWSPLAHCPFCLSPYIAAGVFGLGYFLDWPTWWYVVCSWLTASYLASILVVFDEGSE